MAECFEAVSIDSEFSLWIQVCLTETTCIVYLYYVIKGYKYKMALFCRNNANI